jgi:hypothetical protein
MRDSICNECEEKREKDRIYWEEWNRQQKQKEEKRKLVWYNKLLEKKKWEEGREQREQERKKREEEIILKENIRFERRKQLSQMELSLLFIRTKNYKLKKI